MVPSTLSQKILRLLSNKSLFLTTKKLNIDQQCAENIIVANDKDVIGIGDIDWFNSVKSNLKELRVERDMACVDSEQEVLMDM